MTPAQSTRRFVRRVSVAMVLAVLVVGLAGLVSIRLSTLRSGSVTDVVDPALVTNSTAWRLAADARMAASAPEPEQRATALTAEPTGAAVAAELRRMGPAVRADARLRPLVAAETVAAQTWGASYGALVADPTNQQVRDAEDQAFGDLRRTNAAVAARARPGRGPSCTRRPTELRNAARLSFGLLVLGGLVAMVLVGALAARFLVVPQRALTDVVERLRRGESWARAPTDEGSAEVREIAVALNALADEVEAWRAAQTETERLRKTSLDVSRTVREELEDRGRAAGRPAGRAGAPGRPELVAAGARAHVRSGGPGVGPGRPGPDRLRLPDGRGRPVRPGRAPVAARRRAEPAVPDPGHRPGPARAARLRHRHRGHQPARRTGRGGGAALGLAGLGHDRRPPGLDRRRGVLGAADRRRRGPGSGARSALRDPARAGRQAPRPGPAQGRLPVHGLARAAGAADLDPERPGDGGRRCGRPAPAAAGPDAGRGGQQRHPAGRAGR